MAGLISYVVMSVVMAVVWTIVITSNTDIEDFSKYSKVAFISYLFVANLLAWPVYCIYIACYIMHDYEGHF